LGKKKRRKKKPRQIAQEFPVEDRAAEAVTVAWMLSSMVTFGALVLSGIAWLTIPLLTAQAIEVGSIGIIPRLLLFVATVTGSVSIITMLCAVRLRKVAPPRAVIIASSVICIFPYGVYLLMAVL
jgi:hypothetical protein